MTRGVSILLVVSCGLLLAGVWWAVSRSVDTQTLAPDAHRAESAAGESLSNRDDPPRRRGGHPALGCEDHGDDGVLARHATGRLRAALDDRSSGSEVGR